mmetsp:Transcript_20975/g.58189  ORF Transcript_20975/g.58189 Transcript_20975/m.58189 type:complete len:109 (+) Transcript_20975:3341-3667(+)
MSTWTDALGLLAQGTAGSAGEGGGTKGMLEVPQWTLRNILCLVGPAAHKHTGQERGVGGLKVCVSCSSKLRGESPQPGLTSHRNSVYACPPPSEVYPSQSRADRSGPK